MRDMSSIRVTSSVPREAPLSSSVGIGLHSHHERIEYHNHRPRWLVDAVLDQETFRHNESLAGVVVDDDVAVEKDEKTIGACKAEVASESQTMYTMVASPKSIFHRVVCGRRRP
ncbi:predicted protein [Lichtheimia corymbifera JMRC:FSU:9682]|uniref:Uncharacterized protein n=1 Tax=Lichtheimia corymbifera JMRC:FSU:9682 TaxID=1263082 RepID=A0A068RN29_9FUNG|nr:predicted protein [Lichtheimia corymbifera JMRC:FSU:9682]